MSQIKQLLRLHQQGWKIKTISRELGISKNTVKVYLQRVQQDNWPITSLMALEDPVLEARFHAGNPAYKDTRYQKLKDKLDYYAKQLGVPVIFGLLKTDIRKPVMNLFRELSVKPGRKEP